MTLEIKVKRINKSSGYCLNFFIRRKQKVVFYMRIKVINSLQKSYSQIKRKNSDLNIQTKVGFISIYGVQNQIFKKLFDKYLHLNLLFNLNKQGMFVPVIFAGAALGFGSSLTIKKIIDYYYQKKNHIKKSDSSIKQKKSLINQLNQEVANQFYNLSQTTQIAEKNGKKYICIIGPTSVGKSTLINQLFKLNQSVGLSKTTDKIKNVFQDQNFVVFDSPGKDNDWQLYQDDDIKFFKSIDRCFVLYQGEVKQVKFIGKLLSKMGKELIFVRNQCDKHKQNMKSIDAVLQEDRMELKQLQIQYKQVIASGLNKRSKIMQQILR